MKTIGIVLIVVGILMIVFKGFNFKTLEKVVDLGPVEVNKTENHRIGWPTYIGALAVIGGIVAVASDRKK